MLHTNCSPEPELPNNSPIKHRAAARKARGLEVGSDYPRLADIRRALYAATAPAFLKSKNTDIHNRIYIIFSKPVVQLYPILLLFGCFFHKSLTLLTNAGQVKNL